MIETYVSIGKVTDYAIGVLKYFATASSSFVGVDIFERGRYDRCHLRYNSSNYCADLGDL